VTGGKPANLLLPFGERASHTIGRARGAGQDDRLASRRADGLLGKHEHASAGDGVPAGPDHGGYALAYLDAVEVLGQVSTVTARDGQTPGSEFGAESADIAVQGCIRDGVLVPSPVRVAPAQPLGPAVA